MWQTSKTTPVRFGAKKDMRMDTILAVLWNSGWWCDKRNSDSANTTKECFPKEESFLSIKFHIFIHRHYVHRHAPFIPVNLHHTNPFIGRPADRLPAQQKFISNGMLFYQPSKSSHQQRRGNLKWLGISRDSPTGQTSWRESNFPRPILPSILGGELRIQEKKNIPKWLFSQEDLCS